jgi:hypothetical protein
VCDVRNLGQCVVNPPVRIETAINEDSVVNEYPWQAAYQAAVLETDDAAMSLRIYEGLAAIEQRRLSYVGIDQEEHRALDRAEQGLMALKAERLDPSGTQ